MIQMNSSFFFIKEIQNYTISTNKFIDIKYAECDIEYFESKIIFNYRFYIANNFNLPSDALRLTMDIPSQQISKILLIPSSEPISINHSLVDNKNSKIFKSRIIVDISDDNYFNNLVQQKNIPIRLNFNLDADSLVNNQINVNHEFFTKFIGEISSLTLELKFTHYNFIKIDNAEQINHFSSITINSDFLETTNENRLIIESLELIDRIYLPINKLFWIKILNNKKVELQNVSVLLNYSDKNGEKEVVANLMKNIIFTKEIFVDLDHELVYDKQKKEYVFRLGSNGIKFLFKTKVNMKISFDLIIDNKEVKYLLENNFIWNNLLINTITVDDSKNELSDYKTIYDQK